MKKTVTTKDFPALHLDYNDVQLKTKLRGFTPQANYTDRATTACQRSLQC
jgi:hypothetical protein